MRFLALLLFLGQFLAGAAALAEDGRFFFGYGSAQLSARGYCDGVVARSRAVAADISAAAGFAAAAFRCDDSETARRVMTGIHLGQRLRLELGWDWTGGSAAADAPVASPAPMSMDAQMQSAHLALEGLLPLGRNLSLTGKIGAHLWELDAGFTVSDAVRLDFAEAGIDLESHFDRDGRDLMYGAGLEYYFGLNHWHRMRVGVEWSRLQTDDDNLDGLGITMELDF